MRSDTIYSLMGIAFLKRSTSFSILWITGDGWWGKKQFPEQRAAHSRNGKRTVKMKPENIRIFIKTISMRLIAVQEYKISGRDTKFFILILDQAGTFDQIHKKKTVVAVPPERVSGLVFKISKSYGIKIKPGSRSAGLIEIIVRVLFYFRFF